MEGAHVHDVHPRGRGARSQGAVLTTVPVPRHQGRSHDEPALHHLRHF